MRSTTRTSKPTIRVKSEHEERLAWHIQATLLPDPVREYLFDPIKPNGKRANYRLDFAWPDEKVCCEVDGGLWIQGRHNRTKGYEHDCEKLNELVLQGWRCLRFTPAMVDDARAVRTLERLLRSFQD